MSILVLCSCGCTAWGDVWQGESVTRLKFAQQHSRTCGKEFTFLWILWLFTSHPRISATGEKGHHEQEAQIATATSTKMSLQSRHCL